MGAGFQVRGTVLDGTGAAVDGVSIEVMDLRLGGEHLVGAAELRPDGTFSLGFDPEPVRAAPGASLDLLVRVVRDGEVIARSDTRFDAGPDERIDVELQAGAVPADEYGRLVADLHRTSARTGAGTVRLAAFVENAERRDVTFAAAKSGWDARSVAMASLSGREAERTGIPAALHYALYRAGLPAGPRLWTLAPSAVLESVWSRAAADGIIAPELAEAIPASLETARALAEREVLDLPGGVGDVRLEDLLRTGLPEAADRRRFARIYREHRDSPATLWARVRAEFPGPAARLELDGALAALTRNNAPLIKRLHDTTAPARVGDLAAAGYHRASRWREALTAEVPVPDDVPGDDEDARRDAYARILAEELRLRHPTAVLGAEVAEGMIPVGGPEGTDRAVAEFLAEYHDRFELTVHPVDEFLDARAIDLEPSVREEIATLQRVVAVAGAPQAVRGLRALGFDSARAVALQGEGTFVARFASALGGADIARETFRRSEQVHGGVLATATSHLLARTAPEVFAVPRGGPAAASGPIAAVRTAGARALPNLETLFGSLDTGACEQCESVLSPAAYLVDLLEFLDVDPAVPGGRRPLEVLLSRRPDLQHIALSCENTETELPYVDLVNEILEHVVVNASIDGYAGHDVPPGTGSAELLASPQFVNDAAYSVLRGAAFPLALPWDRQLAALRAYVAQAGVPLGEAMGALAADEERGRSWQDLARERAGIGPAERDLLRGPEVSAQALFGDDPARVTEDQLVAGVGNARRLVRRLGLSPADLVSLLRTRFVNPHTGLLVQIGSLGVGLSAVQALHDGTMTPQAFRAALRPGLDLTPFGGDVVEWLAARHEPIMSVIVLTDPSGQEPPAGDATGGFARLELRRALPDPARNRIRPVDLLGIARFVRLRARLGWSVERTDEVVTALWPTERPVTAPAADVRRDLDAGFDTVLLRLGHLLAAAELLGLDVEEDLPWLLGCFGPLGSRGPDSPFRRLFPASTLLGTDPVFGPGPDGIPPARQDAKLLDHGPALQAALKLTAEEFAVVVRAAEAGPATPLSVASVSALFRYAFLARTLRISVPELVGLIDATGLRPFAPLDGPDPGFLRFVRLAQAIRDSGVPISRVVAPGLGGDAPDVLPVLRAVRAALADRPAPARWSESALRSVLTSVLPPDVSDAFLGLLSGTSTYTAPYAQEQATLPEPVVAVASGLAYDAARALLIHRGVLTPEAAAAVAALPGLPAGLAEAVTVLANAGQAEYLPLLRAHPVLARRWQVWAGSAGDPEAKRDTLGKALLEELRPELRSRLLGEVLGTATGADPAALAVLVEDPVAMPGTAPGRSAADDLAAVTTAGLRARFWAGPITGAPVRTATAPAIDYGPGLADLRQAASVATGPVGGIWDAFVDPAVPGPYVLSVETDAVDVALKVDGRTVPLLRDAGLWTTADPVAPAALRPLRIELTATGLTARLRLRWQAEGVARTTLPGSVCCPADSVDAFTAAYRRLLAALEVAAAFRLSPRELHALARLPELRTGGVGWLSAVPGPASPAASAVLAGAIAALARYRKLCERWAVTGTALADLLDAPATAPAPGPLIAALTGAVPSVVADVAAHLGLAGDAQRTLDGLWRIADVLDLTGRVVLPVGVLARILRTEPSAQDVRDLRDAIRARYDDDAWAEVVRPIHNALRRTARDALVARVMHQENPDPDLALDEVTGGFATPDRLYERLLIDVQMDPCMTTSRIAQAISTVQLFVTRFLLNLELEVPPESIDPKRWEAMKRYRIWEANRRVFLFPENWLDPDLRDDKSPFFREVESELLQSDITDQAASVALGHYLERLDEVAHLEIAGMHVQERDAAGTGVPDPLVHVIGRTSGAKRGYYHRTLDGTWRPWERVNVDIPDDPVLPVIWKGRFLLFWLSVSRQPDRRQPGPFAATAQPGVRLGDLAVKDLALKATATLTVSLFWSEYYNNRWQSPRTSDPDRPIDLGAQFSVIGDPLTLQLASDIETDGTGVRDSLGIVVLNPSPGGTGNSYFRLYTTHSLPVRKQDDTGGPPGFPADRQFSSAGPFVVSYRDDPFHPLMVLRKSQSPYRGVGPMHRLKDAHQAPFFFQDSRHVFYVHPDPTDLLRTTPFGRFAVPAADPLAFPDLIVSG
ncbi:virulence plasmid A protein [Actinocorallia herbida]|uniref:Virulence plasmid A protein n=1 Tax=Actinocorallia herbida TaxID=58109 RepID=A0A3N1CZR6_9ACTN|nr:neuraminidase-like domain-containing protein [Actinocorallia herbida]ROO86777.1 virulence plasmid A protein [Actinocorallia herbida]